MTWRFRRRFVVALVCLVMVAGATPQGRAQDAYSVRDATFLPQVFYVGDVVELRLRLRLDPGVTLPATAPVPSVLWGRIHSITAAQEGQDAEVRVEFTAFRQGTLALPPIRIGDITIQGFDIFVESILGESPELSPLRDQAVLPSTNLLIAGVLTALVMVPLLWLVFVRFGRNRIRQIVAQYRANQPSRRLRKALRQLSAEMESMRGRDFYITLQEDLRRYISQKLSTDCMSATTAELRGFLDRIIEERADRDVLIDLFKHGDLVKFARGRSTVKKRRQHLEAVRRVVENVEHRQRRRREEHVGVS
ncbi:MAG: hypothetical protein ACLFO1_01310 [Spirochaetaceae bacterium]